MLAGEPDPATHRLPSLHASLTPAVYVVTTPSELITFSGPPAYAPIPSTHLLYATNTSGNVFKLLTDQQNYILISGRWYRAASLNGPWQFVPCSQLPRDFTDLPDTSPKENVKASVPGTVQAEEALIANSIPQSTAVSRTNHMRDPQIDGPVQLSPIEGTPLHYVVNGATPIIEVEPQSWYACQDAVWYTAPSVQGPWTVAVSVPAVIYTIPPTSPLCYVAYVHIYGSTPDVVYEGYTPGYLGTEVASNGTVVYGTGYDYAPWIGSVWYGPPVTWGCGFADCWTPWWGWGYDCGFGWGWGYPGFGWWDCYPPCGWWGGFRNCHDHDGDELRFGNRPGLVTTGIDLYRPQSQLRGVSEVSALYSPRLAISDARVRSLLPSSAERSHGGPGGRFVGLNRGFQRSASRGARGASGGYARWGSGGWLHSLGGLFHSSAGAFHAGLGVAGGSHGGGGVGGGGHGGGGGGSGGGHR